MAAVIRQDYCLHILIPGHLMIRAAFSVSEFCLGHGISRTHFYELAKTGRGPRLMRVGRRVLISETAAADWRRRAEAEGHNQK